jgi:hypothetical protein
VSPTTRHDTAGRAAAGGPDDVGGYVAAVRARLDDLAPEEVEELTGGMEADLAEALAGLDETPRQRFGDPAAYADELRAAADLPPRREPAVSGNLDRLRRDVAAAVDLHLDAVQRLPWFAAVRDFLVVLRPAWWVLRAWIAVAALRLFFTAGETGIVGSFPALVLLVLAVVGSVMLGLRSPLPSQGARGLLIGGNILAVVLLPMILSSFASPSHEWTSGGTETGRGLWMDGQPVQNIVPYDSQGRPLQGVQLYDDMGRPLQIGEEFRWYGDRPEPQRWNVFPIPTPSPEEDVFEEPTDEPAGEPPPAPTQEGTTAPTPSATVTTTPSAPPTATVTPTR